MNGIDKIIARLNADVDAEIAKIQEETAARCAEIRAEYKTQAENEYWELIQVGVKQTEQRVQRLDRTVHLEVRKHILALKQELVAAAFNRARDRILELPKEEYVAFLARKAAEAAVTGQEELILSETDTVRCGAETVRAANALLKERGIQPGLTLGEARHISGGVILKQGDIEVNCTLDTLLELVRGEMAAQVAEVLFPPEA
ncbi:MAG: V-type ATP synthase subunit E [Eubacteriales bacterium]|nr:V-type ATP synthase subunit E [Eubacteriales bacterium]